jgi:hypothetical protein
MGSRPTKPIDEYRAMAMLLGKKYSSETHSFYKPGTVLNDIDADTLEPLSVDEVSERMGLDIQQAIGGKDEPAG